MKFAKLGFKTKEGLSLAHFQDGWSMEYGEGGSYTCEVLLDGKKVITLEEAGNGGPINYWYETKDQAERKKVDDAVLAFLRRTNKAYGPDSEYDFCKNATEASDLEYSSMAEDLINAYADRKEMKSMFKKGYMLAAVVNYPNGMKQRFYDKQVSKKGLIDYIAQDKSYKPECEITFYYNNSNPFPEAI